MNSGGNPLKYIDPDGRKDQVYHFKLLGEKFEVKISDKIGKDAQAAILKNITATIEKINAGGANLTPEQKKVITSMNGISVVADSKKAKTGMAGSTFQITQHRVLNSTLDGLTADVIHDSAHPDQANRGLSYNEKTACQREREASKFALGVFPGIGVTEERIVQTYEEDAARGHTPYKNQTCLPPKND